MPGTNPYLTRTALRDANMFVGRTYEISAILSRIYASQPQSTRSLENEESVSHHSCTLFSEQLLPTPTKTLSS